MTEQITVRTATMNDIDVLLQFEQGVINAERPFDPTLKSEHINYYDVKEMVENPEVEIVVAEDAGNIIASGYARIMSAKTYFKHGKYAYLGFMFVHPEYRGKGVNAMIIETLKQWSAAQGLSEMRLQVYCDNVGAIRAYEKVGFNKHMVEMRMGI